MSVELHYDLRPMLFIKQNLDLSSRDRDRATNDVVNRRCRLEDLNQSVDGGVVLPLTSAVPGSSDPRL